MAFILLITSHFTVLNYHLCALDTTLRIVITWDKLHVMSYISLPSVTCMPQAGIDQPRLREFCFQTTALPPSFKPPRLDIVHELSLFISKLSLKEEGGGTCIIWNWQKNNFNLFFCRKLFARRGNWFANFAIPTNRPQKWQTTKIDVD